jgi:hypothetical protein
MVRWLLVGSAVYLGTVRPDTDLRRYGLRLNIEGEELHAIFRELKGALREHTEGLRKLDIAKVWFPQRRNGRYSRNPFQSLVNGHIAVGTVACPAAHIKVWTI